MLIILNQIYNHYYLLHFCRAITVSSGVSVLTATKKMLEGQKSSAIVTVGNKPQGILT